MSLEELPAPWPGLVVIQGTVAEHPPAGELPHAAHSWSDSRKVQWWNGRRALRAACASVGILDCTITTTPQGAPAVHGARVSIAHTRDAVVAVASTSWGRVGIDVERKDRDVHRLVRALSDEERTFVEHKHASVLELVMAKEAASKAMGTGLEGSLARWPVSREADNWVVRATSAHLLRVRTYDSGDWVVAVAVGDG